MKKLLIYIIGVFSAVHAAAGKPKMTEYLPADTVGARPTTAVIVCPGGSYCWLARRTEGSEVAEWLASKGYAAYVLEYPTAGWAAYTWHTRLVFGGARYPDQLDAIQTAIRELRRKGWQRVGAVGFSAGGHLVLNAAEDGPADARPDFVAAIYPVVTMNAPAVHRRSRRGLMGERRWRNQTLRDSLSMERHAGRISCPVFLANCDDDPVVDPRNAQLMDSALTAEGLPHEYHRYATGGHGFGINARKTSSEAIAWADSFIAWLRKLTADS